MMGQGGALPVVVLASALAGEARPSIFHVSPEGRDAWSGRLEVPAADGADGPLASLAGARDAIRRWKAAAGLKEPVEVRIRPGVYRLTEPLVLEPADSGSPPCPITYRAAEEARPVLSGGRRITGWQKQAEGLWTARVGPAVFRQLFVNGRRRPLARVPNEGFFRIVGQAGTIRDPATGREQDSSRRAFRFRPGDIQPWERLAEIDAVVFFHWETAMLPLAAVDAANHTVIFSGSMNWPFWGRQRYYIENVFAGLDAPGEWYLDRRQGELYYRPMPDEDLTQAEVIAPHLTHLVRLEGEPDKGRFVEHIRFQGLAFQHNDYRLPPEGHGDHQAAVSVPGAIQAVGARHVTIEQCEVSHIGTYAIWFAGGCTHNRVVQNEIGDAGAGGVRLGEAQKPRSDPWASGHNVVANNFIHDIGHVYYGAVGVWVGQSSDNVIAHNEICETYYTAISVGWSWGFAPTACHRNVIEYNHLHHVGQGMLSDMGAIYTLGISTGTVIRNNHIHHVWEWPEGYGAGGIYPDEGSTGLRIENNVVYLATSGGLTVHYGRENVVRNNVFAFGRDRQISTGRKDKNSSLALENNIIYYEDSEPDRPLLEGTDQIQADRNVYWNAAGPVVFPDGLSLAGWQAKGLDRHSLVADPLFVDAKRFDFRLRPESPALKLGFRPIDVSAAGLTGPKSWTDRPGRVQRPATTIPERIVPPPLVLDDGFETTPVGATAEAAYVHGEAQGASIRVTEEQAATGRRCLKFTDAPGLDYPWNPHMYYQPHVREGRVQLAFDLRLEPGASLCQEWRDAGAPYRVGPSLSIDGQGQLFVGGKPLLKLPPQQWVHFVITGGFGPQANGTWDLEVTIGGQKPTCFRNLTCDPNCRRLQWLGFISTAVDRRVFYVDNLRLTPVTR